jgi:hypothetical protein
MKVAGSPSFGRFIRVVPKCTGYLCVMEPSLNVPLTIGCSLLAVGGTYENFGPEIWCTAMTASKKFTQDQEKIEQVLALYCQNPRKPTIMQVAEMMGTPWHNVHAVLKQQLASQTLKNEQKLRYSRSKMNDRNPMKGKNGSRHHNYKGVVEDGKGYLQIKVGDEYILLHRYVMAQALGLEKLPHWLDVHHIDEDTFNNDVDNLALVTTSGHGKLHAKRSKFEKLPLWEQWEYGISKLKETILTQPTVS